MYYPEEVVEEIRQRNDIVQVISSYVRLQKRGSNHMGLCPFHNEKTPSFSVSGSKQMYHCFGCGASGNVFTFIMEYENFNFVEALRFLAERGGVNLPEMEYSEEDRKRQDFRTKLLEVNKVAAKYFYYLLRTERGQHAYTYLKDRGLTDETIKKFGLGYSDKYSDDLYQYLKKQGYRDELLKESGLVTMNEAKGSFDKFWNRVMYPIMDINHKVIGFGGRVMGEGMPKYLNSPETKIFDKSRNLYGLNFARQAKGRQLLLCEGYMDVISLHQAGFHNAVASLGTAFTERQAVLIKRYADEVLLTYDSDGAGIKAALRAIPMLKSAGITPKIVHMEPYKDPDEFIKSLGAEEFQKRIDQAENSFYFEVSLIEREYDFKDPEQKTKFYNELAKKLLVFSEELERNNYIEAMAVKYAIRFEDLRKLVNKYGAQLSFGVSDERTVKEEKKKERKGKEDGIKRSQKILLTWLIEDTSLFAKIRDILTEEDFKEEPYHTVAKHLFTQYEQTKTVNPAKIINCFESKEEQAEVASLFNTNLPIWELLSEENARMKKEEFHENFMQEMELSEKEKAFNDTIRRIKKNSLDEAGRHVTDVADLQKLITAQAELQKLHISFQDGER